MTAHPDLDALWPPADGASGGYRRASLGGTRLVAATSLPCPGEDRRRMIAVARGDPPDGRLSVVPLVTALARVEPASGTGQRPGLWRASAGDGVASALVAAIREGVPLGDGFLGVRLDVGGDAPAGPTHWTVAERGVGVDQTNESVVVDERLVVKWLLHPDGARERAPRLVRHLAAAGFAEMPRPFGLLAWRAHPAAPPLTVAMVDAWLPDAQDGWEWCSDALAVHAAAGHRCGAGCPAGFASDLGALVARLHAALATPTDVIPDPIATATRVAVAGWATTARRTLAEAVTLTTRDDAAAGEELTGLTGVLEARLGMLDEVQETLVGPVHGDLHVGQILRGPHGLALIDLEGNPTADAATVLAPAPVARDVAGMLCSLDHVGRVAIRRGAEPAHVEAWIPAARDGFLAAYRAGLVASGHLELLDERLLPPFGVEQECRELIYAARFLPRWRYAPLGAMRAMVSA